MIAYETSLTLTLSAPTRGRGFTLAELVVSMVIMSILMVGLGSAILIASHALPDDERPATRIVQSASVAGQIVEELRSAIWIREHTVTSVEFAVPDREGDGNADRIRYAWSGTSGDPLTRQYNGGKVVDVLDDVNEFDLGYDLKAVTEEYPGAPVEGAEQELASHGNIYGDAKSFPIEKNEWPGQYFKPTLTGDAVNWRVTKVYVYVRADGPEIEETAVQLRLPDGNRLPTDAILDEYALPESSLHDWYEWHEIPFSNMPALRPGSGLCLVLKNASGGGVSGRIWYDDGGGSGGINTKDGGNSWSYFSNIARLHYVYGTVGTPGPPQSATRYYVTGVRVAMQAGSDPGARVVTTAQTLNRPELLSGLWETDFETDPRLDHNGDGNDDWVVGTGTFVPGSLVGGAWHVDSKLESSPDNDFVKLTTAEVRFRNIGIGGMGAVFRINADWSGGTYAPIQALLQLQADNTQTLTVFKALNEATLVELVRVTGLSSGFVNLRLVIDPDLDTVSVTVGGVHRGTYRYSKFPPPETKRYVSMASDVSASEYDYVSVRVAE